MKTRVIRTGIIGCGNIGGQVALFLRHNPYFKVTTLTDVSLSQATALRKKFRGARPEIVSLEEALKRNDLVIESACPAVVIEILRSKNLDKRKKKILFMSSGGLIHSLNRISKLKNAEVFIPSGALAGLDAIKAIAGEIESLQLVTTKPAHSLAAAPYVRKNRISLGSMKAARVIFEGGLSDAVKGFPVNINVAASLFLASRFKKLRIKIVADPEAKFNTHEITCSGKFGVITTKTQNLPSRNPKTSQLAISSALSVLQGMTEKIRIGN